jgi:hypothetical protein
LGLSQKRIMIVARKDQPDSAYPPKQRQASQYLLMLSHSSLRFVEHHCFTNEFFIRIFPLNPPQELEYYYDKDFF